MSVEGLNRLKVWVWARDFAVSIYKKVLPLLPAEEKWNLNQQLRRSSLSVSANVAEGLYKELTSEGDEIDKMLNGYISYLKKSKQGAGEPGANHYTREERLLYTIESGEDTVL